MFIILHDCAHGSFVASPFWRQVIGNVLGVLTFTSFADWRRSHGIHHTTSGNLDRRGIGDVWTMTMEEYAASSPARRLWYRIFRNPFVMFGLGPFVSFVIGHRMPTRGSGRNQIVSVILTDVVIAGIIVAAAVTIGIKAYLLIQMPIMFIGGAGGVWLFYVQHQFDPSYWARTEEWESMDAALRGSSYYKLPKVLQWISGQHRASPHPPPPAAHPQLQPPGVPERDSRAAAPRSPPLLAEPEIGAAEGLGRKGESSCSPSRRCPGGCGRGRNS